VLGTRRFEGLGIAFETVARCINLHQRKIIKTA
jgi:hypothetical protein